MEGLIASSPVPPVLVVVGVLVALLLVVIVYPYVNRNRFTETFGLRPDTKSPIVGELVKWTVDQRIAALDAEIAAADAQTKQTVDDYKRTHQSLGTAGSIGNIRRLEEQREALIQERKRTIRLAQVNGAPVAVGPPVSIHSSLLTNGKVEKTADLVPAGRKSP